MYNLSEFVYELGGVGEERGGKMIDSLSILDIRTIQKRLEWTEEFEKDGRLWLAEGRKIRDEYGLTDKEVLDIANNRLQKYLLPNNDHP